MERTSEQLQRELFEAIVDGRFGVVTTRIDAMDRALKLVEAYPTEVDRAVGRLRELVFEMFKSRDSGLISAFEAQKALTDQQHISDREAIAKAETSTGNQINQQGDLLNATRDSLHLLIANLATRLTTLESLKIGNTETRTQTGQNLGYIIGLGGFLLAVFVFLTGGGIL